MKKNVAFLAVAFALAFQNTYAAEVYFNDFSSSVGSGWTSSSETPLIATSPSGEKFLGTDSTYGFSNGSVNLSLSSLPAHTSVTVTFDLYAIQSLDGNGDYGAWGPDIISFSSGGINYLYTTFGNTTLWQSYPGNYPSGHAPRTGALSNNVLGYTYYGDSIYRLTFDIPHSSSSLDLTFSASGLEVIDNESWGLDNVHVQLNPVPVPAAVWLFGSGLIGLVGIRRKFKK